MNINKILKIIKDGWYEDDFMKSLWHQGWVSFFGCIAIRIIVQLFS